MNEPLVSVACVTYNQEDTVEQMLKGILEQKTSFRFEVIIHDDCSKDNTPDIIKKYADLYPDVIIPVFEKENQFSKGKKILITYVYPLVRGKYIAYCEGDDYWTDKYKLQKQFDALENNADCSICVHNVACITNSGMPLDEKFPGIDIEEGVIYANRYLQYEFVEKSWLFQTTSYFVKSSIMKKLCTEIPKFVNTYPVGDLPIVLLCLQEGNCYYIKRDMSVYRKNSGGVLTKNKNNIQREINYYEKMLEGHREFKKYTKNEYRKYVEHTILVTEIFLKKLKGEYKKIDNKEYLKVKDNFSYKNRVLIKVGKVFPKITYLCFKIMRNM